MATAGTQQSCPFDGWDPMEEDYQDPSFNSYDTGPGRNLPPPSTLTERDDGTVQLYVVGIPNELNEEGLRNLFSDDGQLKVLQANKVKSKQPQRGDTFGFVKYGSVREAELAIRKFDQFRIGPFRLRVKVALSDEKRAARRKEKEEEEEFLKSLNCAKTDPDQEKRMEHEVEEEIRRMRLQNQSKADFVMNFTTRESPLPSAPPGGQVVNQDRPALDSVSPETGRYTPVDSGYHSGETRTQTNAIYLGGDGDHHREHSIGNHAIDKSSQPEITSPNMSDQSAAGNAKKCLKCGGPGFLRCGACKSPYCSPACQREDFSEHKVQCKTIRETAELAARFEVSVDDEMQYLVGELPQVSLGDPTARVKSPLKSMTESSDPLPQRAERSDPLPQRAERSDTLSQRAERSDPPPSTRGGPEKYMSAKMTRVSLPLQKKCQVKIIDLSSPSDLCVIFPDSVPQLVKLIQDMKEARHCSIVGHIHNKLDPRTNRFYYSGTTNIGPGAYVPSVGEVCAVQYAVDGGWYRAMVEEITLNGQVRVRYQDYGNVEERPVMYTRKLLPEFTQLPLQGMRCCIANVAPVQGSDWSDHVTSELKTVVDSLGGLFDVVCEQVVNGISHIQLLTEEGGNVGEALIYQNMARQSSEEVLYDAALATSSAETEQNMARQSSEEVYAATMATSSVETEQNMARQSPEVPYAAQKTTLSVESEQWGQSPNSSTSLDTIYLSLLQSALSMLKINEPFDAAVFHIETSEVFYIHHIDETFVALSLAMNEKYNTMSTQQTYRFKSGDMVAAQWQGAWYRALVLADMASTSKVFYLDYGNTEEVSNTAIRPLLEDFADHPPKAIRCSLAGVKIWAKNPEVPHAVQQVLQEKLVEKVVKVNMVSTDDNRALVKLTLDDGTDVGRFLVDSGFATFTDTNQVTEQSEESNMSPLVTAQTKESPKSATSPTLPVVRRGARSPLSCITSELSLPPVSKSPPCVSGARSPLSVSKSPPCVSGARSPLYEDRSPNSSSNVLRARTPPSPRPAVTGARAPAFPRDTQRKRSSNVRDAPSRPRCLTHVDLPKLELPEDREFPLLLVHCVSPWEFFICLPDLIEKVAELEVRLQTHALTDHHPHRPEVGEVVLAQFTDGVWYRAMVQADQGPQIGYQVYFCDYGNTEYVQTANIRKILEPELVTGYPRQAYQCKLAGVREVNKESSVKAAEEMKTIHPGSILVRVVRKEGEVYSVNLTTPDGDSMAHYLTGQGLVAVSDLVPHPDSAFQPIQPAVCTALTAPEPRVMTYDLIKASLDSSVTMVIVCNPDSSPKLFYCWNMSKQQEMQEVVTLKDRLGEVYEHVHPDPAFRPLVEEMCVTFAEGEDGGWSRAAVQAILPNNKYKIFYVDFGQEDVIPGDKLYRIEPQFTTLPLQAIKCALSYCFHSESQTFPPQAVDKFKGLVQGTLLQAKLIGTKNMTHYVELCDPKTKKNIGSELVKIATDSITQRPDNRGTLSQLPTYNANKPEFQQNRRTGDEDQSIRGNRQKSFSGNRHQGISDKSQQDGGNKNRPQDQMSAGGDAGAKAFIDRLNQGGKPSGYQQKSGHQGSPDRRQKQSSQKSPGPRNKQQKSPESGNKHQKSPGSGIKQQKSPGPGIKQQNSPGRSYGGQLPDVSAQQQSGRSPLNYPPNKTSQVKGHGPRPSPQQADRSPVGSSYHQPSHVTGYEHSTATKPSPQQAGPHPSVNTSHMPEHQSDPGLRDSTAPGRVQSGRSPFNVQTPLPLEGPGYGRSVSTTPIPQLSSHNTVDFPPQQDFQGRGHQEYPLEQPLRPQGYDPYFRSYPSHNYQARRYENPADYREEYREMPAYHYGNYPPRGGYRGHHYRGRGGFHHRYSQPLQPSGLEQRLERLVALLEQQQLLQLQQHQDK